jgi:hypothetical protein
MTRRLLNDVSSVEVSYDENIIEHEDTAKRSVNGAMSETASRITSLVLQIYSVTCSLLSLGS